MTAAYEDTTVPTLRFERMLPHPVDAVWRAITDPAEMEHWFPTAVALELRLGGSMDFSFPSHDLPPMTGQVTELDPPRRLSFLWGADHLHFELQPIEDGVATRLRFSVELDTADKAARDGAGWHVCLDRLAGQLAGNQAIAAGDQPAGEWEDHYAEYQRRGFPAAAPIIGL
jgi:uncharacterized protein YndB with AHSA1/START domain